MCIEGTLWDNRCFIFVNRQEQNNKLLKYCNKLHKNVISS